MPYRNVKTGKENKQNKSEAGGGGGGEDKKYVVGIYSPVSKRVIVCYKSKGSKKAV